MVKIYGGYIRDILTKIRDLNMLKGRDIKDIASIKLIL